MLRHVLFDLSLFPSEDERPSSQKRILALLQALTYCNQLYLRDHPETPLIYQSGIKYKVPEQFEKAELPEVATVRDYLANRGAPESVVSAFLEMANQVGAGEHFRDIPRIIENGGGDCDNVASWRAAELRELGINARPYITWRKRSDGGTTYHVIVRWPDGSSEDPSLLLGMSGEARQADREEEERKLGERCGNFLKRLGCSNQTISTVLGGLQAATPFSAQGGLPSDFGKGLQYSIPFQTDDSYESWSPTRPQAYYANPQYPGGLISQSGPIFNTRLRDSDDDFDDDDRFDGSTPSKRRAHKRHMKRKSR